MQSAGYPCGMLYLASQSPRRRELLGRLGLDFGVLDLDSPRPARFSVQDQAAIERLAEIFLQLTDC